MMWILRGITTAGMLTLAGLIAAAPAGASCLPSPLASSHHFTGTVTEVENAGRTATVATDEGRTVTVNGSEVNDSESDPNVSTVTSVDRSYQVGTRYEFHPLNAASPYQDNACTATHAIAARAAESRSAGDLSPSAARDAADEGRRIPLWTAGGIVVVAVAAGLWLIRRRRSP